MSQQTHIQWCDSTINFWSGCTKVSAGCTHCYAEHSQPARTMGIKWGKGQPRRRHYTADRLTKTCQTMAFICEKCGRGNPGSTFCYHDGCDGHMFHRRRIFSLSLGDWLDEEVDPQWLAEMLFAIFNAPHCDWLLLTKRPELFYERLNFAQKHMPSGPPAVWLANWHVFGQPPPNVMLLVSVEDQKAADERIPILLDLPAARRGLSCEPLLGQVYIAPYMADAVQMLDWVIIGGESGPRARPCRIEWIRDLKEQCQFARVPVFVKQLGANVEGTEFPGINRKPVYAHPKGGDINEWPADLRVREFYR